MATEEDRLMERVEKTSLDETLRYIAKTRRDQLWSESGPLGLFAIELKNKNQPQK